MKKKKKKEKSELEKILLSLQAFHKGKTKIKGKSGQVT